MCDEDERYVSVQSSHEAAAPGKVSIAHSFDKIKVMNDTLHCSKEKLLAFYYSLRLSGLDDLAGVAKQKAMERSIKF